MMDPRSEGLLAHVHPDLCKVIRAAAQNPQPFLVVYGIRTLAAEQQAVATGHSTTMHSRHLPQAAYATDDDPDGLSCAVDVAALVNGQPNFAPGHEAQVFGEIAAQVKAAAAVLGIPVEWGGDWHSFKDWGHFQLPWAQYP
jgi:peptidoglycan L-alanyl-D-glutamate endopeptidase CwlK